MHFRCVCFLFTSALATVIQFFLFGPAEVEADSHDDETLLLHADDDSLIFDVLRHDIKSINLRFLRMAKPE